MAEIERALSTLVASTGNYLIPEVVDPVIRDYIWRATPLLTSGVTRMPWPTHTYYVRKRATLPTASWKLDDVALPAASNSTYTKVAKNVKFLYIRGEVTGPIQAASGGVVNALQEEIRVSARTVAEQLTKDIVVGDASPAEEIDGMLNQVPTGEPGDEGGTRTETTNLSLAMLDRAIDDTLGEGNIILTSRKVRRAINALLQAQQRFVDSTEVSGGFRVPTYDGIPILTDLHWEDDNDILIYRREDAKLLVNTDFTFSPLAKTKDSDDYFIKGYFGFALEGRPVRLTGFTLPASVL